MKSYDAFDAEELEVAVHAAFGDFALDSRREHAPVRATALGLLIQGFANQPRDAILLNRARTPLAHGRRYERIATGNDAIAVTGIGGQHNPRSRDQRRRHRTRCGNRGQLGLFAPAQRQLGLRSTARNIGISKVKDTSMAREKYATNQWDRILAPRVQFEYLF